MFRQELVLAVIVTLALGRTTWHMVMLAAAALLRRAKKRKRSGTRPLLPRPLTPREHYAHADAIAAILARHDRERST